MRQRNWNTGWAWRAIRSLRAALCPPASRCISARSRAAASVVSMRGRRVGGHRVLNLLVETKGKVLHLGQVTAALFGRHGLADFIEVPQHVGLALGSESGDLSQLLFRSRSHALRVVQHGLKLPLLGGDTGAVFMTLGQVTFVQLPDALHLGVAEPKLTAQPREIVAATGKLARADLPGQHIRTADDGYATQEQCDDDEEGPAHGLLAQGGRAYRVQVARFGQVVGVAGALGDAERKAEQKHGCGCRQRPARTQEPRGDSIEPVCGGSLRPLNTAPHGSLEAGREVGREAGFAQGSAELHIIRYLAIVLHNPEGGPSAISTS